jgi:tRNA(Ile)-lysidine synthase
MAAPLNEPEPAGAFLERLRAQIEALPIDDWRGRRSVVAFSGGVDSTLLLAGLRRLGWGAPLVAVHVDHGLQNESGDWALKCQSIAGRLDLPCETLSIRVAPAAGASLEAAARAARYRALRQWLKPRDVLMTAHHGDDQLETVLMRILRGTGVRGLAAIHPYSEFGAGCLVRPLLAFSRAEILAQALAWDLEWVEDPMNADPSFDRVYLRTAVLPALKHRWPVAHRQALQLSRQMSEAEALLAELAAIDLGSEADLEAINVARLEALPLARRNNLLRFLIRRLGLPPPAAVQLAELNRAFSAGGDRQPCVAWPGAEARLYRGRLYLMPPLLSADGAGAKLTPEQAWIGTAGRLELRPTAAGGIPDRLVQAGLEVRHRIGGEQLRVPGLTGRKSLKQWFQEQAVLPWMRDRLPLVTADGQILAIADRVIADFGAETCAQRWLPVWTGYRRIR